MDAKRYFVVMVVALLSVLFAGVLVSCGAFDRGTYLWKGPYGQPYVASPEKIIAPSEAVVGETVIITVEFATYFLRRFVRAEASIQERELQIAINLWFQKREANYSLPYWGLAQEDITIVFPSPGNWTIRSGEMSVPITVLMEEE